MRRNGTHKLPIFVPCLGTFWILIFKWAMCTILIHFHDGWVTHQAMLFCAQMVSLFGEQVGAHKLPKLAFSWAFSTLILHVGYVHQLSTLSFFDSYVCG